MNQKTINPCTGKEPCTGRKPHTGKEPCAGRETCNGGKCTGKELCNGDEPHAGKETCTGEKPCAGNRLDDAAGKLHTVIETRIEKHLRKTSRTNIISEDISYTNSSCRKQICTKTFTKEFCCCMEVN